MLCAFELTVLTQLWALSPLMTLRAVGSILHAVSHMIRGWAHPSSTKEDLKTPEFSSPLEEFDP